MAIVAAYQIVTRRAGPSHEPDDERRSDFGGLHRGKYCGPWCIAFLEHQNTDTRSEIWPSSLLKF